MTAASINFYFARQDHIIYERNDNPLFVTLIALTTLANKSVFQLLYMWQYASQGYGSLFYRIQSTLCNLMSQFAICLLFLVLAYGYGTVKQRVNVQDFRPFLLPLSAALLMHLCIVILIIIDHEERHKWHDFQGPSGELLCLIRLVLFGIFCHGCWSTW